MLLFQVENVIREDYLIEAYELMELFCELLSTRLPLIDMESGIPQELKEAISTIIYVSPRTADVPELTNVRNNIII